MTKSINRKNMKLSNLLFSKAKLVAQFVTRDGRLYEPNNDIKPTFDTSSPGFYFLVPLPTLGEQDPDVYARFYVGRQRLKCGLENVAAQLRLQRSMTGKKIMGTNFQFDVYYINIKNIKPLTTGYPKTGKIALALTRKHKGDYQNLEELNRILNDNFKFVAQKY